jgi:hypothetical protein
VSRSIKIQTPYASGIKILLFSAVLITLYFNPRFADPFNSAKLYVLVVTSFFVISYFSTQDKLFSAKNREIKNLLFFLAAFYIAFLLLLPTNKGYHNFFIGESQRNTGFLAYFSFGIFMFIAAKHFKFNHQNIFYSAILVLGSVYTAYGLMQAQGKDFVEWNNPYNAIIGTLGNPNFAAALMAILLILTFGFTFLTKMSNIQKTINILIVIGLALNIYLSNARQGILSALLGVGFFSLIVIYKLNKIMGLFTGIILLAVGATTVLGMLQVGPLTQLLYKDSISLRGYYWRAGIEMFFANPFTGVGIERYGSSFKMFREPAYPLKYGYELVSTNAHNVYIQFFATGGIGLGLTYILINLYILKRGVIGLRNLDSNELVLFVTIFSGWLSFQAQSLISIDNSGLTVWGWILGGMIIGLSSENNVMKSNVIGKPLIERKRKKTSNPIFPGITLITSFVFVLLLSRSETNVFLARVAYNPENKKEAIIVQSFARKVIDDPLAAPYYKFEVSNYLIQSGMENEGLSEFEKIADKYPMNPLYLNALASMYEYKGRFQESIDVRENILIYDPQNINNMLQLARLYRDTQNQNKSIQMKKLINQFAPQSEQSDIVNKEIPF